MTTSCWAWLCGQFQCFAMKQEVLITPIDYRHCPIYTKFIMHLEFRFWILLNEQNGFRKNRACTDLSWPHRIVFFSTCQLSCKKGQQYLFCFWKLSSFHVDRSLMTMFYKSCIESILTFSKNAPIKIVEMSCKILGVQHSTLSDFSEFHTLPSGSRLSPPPLKSNRYRHSFIPTAISILNSDHGRS